MPLHKENTNFAGIKVSILKELLINIYKAYILFNFHVALSVAALYLIFNDHPNRFYLSFIIFSTVLSYTFIRLLSFSGNRYFIKKFYAKNKKLLIIVLIISILISLISFFNLPNQTQILLVPLFVITGLYNFEYKNIPKLRDFGLIKIMIVAFVWTGITVLIPQISFLHTSVILKAGFVFLYIIMLTLAFDQRDILIDKSTLKTIPQRFYAYLKYIYWILFFTLLSINLLIFEVTDLFLANIFLFISFLLCIRSTKQKSFYYTAFWIEGIPILWFIVLFLTKKIHL